MDFSLDFTIFSKARESKSPTICSRIPPTYPTIFDSVGPVVAPSISPTQRVTTSQPFPGLDAVGRFTDSPSENSTDSPTYALDTFDPTNSPTEGPTTIGTVVVPSTGPSIRFVERVPTTRPSIALGSIAMDTLEPTISPTPRQSNSVTSFPTVGATLGSTPTVSTKVTGPPTKSGRENMND